MTVGPLDQNFFAECWLWDEPVGLLEFTIQPDSSVREVDTFHATDNSSLFIRTCGGRAGSLVCLSLCSIGGNTHEYSGGYAPDQPRDNDCGTLTDAAVSGFGGKSGTA